MNGVPNFLHDKEIVKDKSTWKVQNLFLATISRLLAC